MSFGSKQYQHRFYTAPKIRTRHVQDFMMSPQFNHQRYRSVSAFNPYPQSPIQQSSMKESYLRLVNNGLKSRLYTKDQLGYEGVKFQNDVISRYCDNDYKKNSQILQKFKRQAEQSKRNKKYRHLRQNTKEIHHQDNRLPDRNQNHQFIDKNSISLLPITNSGVYSHPHSPQRLLSIKNTQNLIPNYQQSIINTNRNSQPINGQNSHFLPSLKLQKYLNSHINDSASGAIYEEESQNQHQNQQIQNHKIKNSVVRDVGINAHLTTIQSEQNNHTRRQSERYMKNLQKISHQRKKSQSLRIQTMKLKNKHLKKKYDKLKRQLMQKSHILSQHQHLQEQRQQVQQQQKLTQNYENLSIMIHDLCDKLRENNSKILISKSKSSERSQNESKIYESKIVAQPQQNSALKPQKDSKNQTQINLLKTNRIQQLLKKQQIQQNTQAYTKQLQKIEGFRNNKPKVIYTFNKQQKYVKNDALRLLKNRMQQKHFHVQLLGDYSSNHKGRSKTQGD